MRRPFIARGEAIVCLTMLALIITMTAIGVTHP